MFFIIIKLLLKYFAFSKLEKENDWKGEKKWLIQKVYLCLINNLDIYVTTNIRTRNNFKAKVLI